MLRVANLEVDSVCASSPAREVDKWRRWIDADDLTRRRGRGQRGRQGTRARSDIQQMVAVAHVPKPDEERTHATAPSAHETFVGCGCRKHPQLVSPHWGRTGCGNRSRAGTTNLFHNSCSGGVRRYAAHLVLRVRQTLEGICAGRESYPP